jgi:hypothetical protein
VTSLAGEALRQRCLDAVVEEDAHVRGTAAQPLLRLWGRPADVTLEGDRAAETLLRGR